MQDSAGRLTDRSKENFVRLSTRSRFGTRLILDLAQHGDNGPVALRAVADRQHVSRKYLEQILRPLRRAGVVNAFRGQKGGYLLNKRPEDILVGEIVAILERYRSHCIENPRNCIWYGRCLLHPLLEEAFAEIFARLNQITFADLMRGEHNALQ